MAKLNDKTRWNSQENPWDGFVAIARIVFECPVFNDWERAYKLRSAARIKAALEAASRDPGEYKPLSAALRHKDQNVIRWQDVDPFLKWYRSELPKSHEALASLIEPGRPVEQRIRGFLAVVPEDVVKGRASRTTLVSVLLGALDPEHAPLFRTRAFEWAYKIVSYPTVADGADEADRYLHGIGFIDRMLEEARRRGLELKNRLDAQGILWGMSHWDRPEGMTDEQWEALVAFRKGTPPEPEKLEQDTKVMQNKDPLTRLVRDRKNVILYGPPGTGKTLATLQLAERWRRSQGDSSVWQVTFHPSFSYEDFIEGFRPNSEGRFELRPGIFVQFCDAARKAPGKQFLLLIDEINRGDVARLFGELITLIEPDKRSDGARRKLPYSQREFYVPGNVHLLGTMNTADRSISLLDIAVRRRFCFKELRPDSEVVRGSRDHHHQVGGIVLASLLEGLNHRLLAAGIDRDRAIGHSYLLIPAAVKDPLHVLRERLRYDIIPLIEEYCYADRSLIRQIVGQLATSDGQADEAVINNDARLTEALGDIAAQTPVQSASGGAGTTDDGR